LPEAFQRGEWLAARATLCERGGVDLARIELRYAGAEGEPLSIAIDRAADRTSALGAGNIALSVRIENAGGATIARATVENRGDTPVRLDSMRFEIATGLATTARARFFKHGYQSWSASAGVEVGAREHRHDRAPFIVRVNHQSEVDRPADAPEYATSELFTIVEADGRAERMLAGFIGGASQLTTLTVLAPDRIVARALLDGVVLAPRALREIEPLYFTTSDESASALAARWASMLGTAMHARAGAPYQRGWCSWYHYFHAVTEDALRANLKSLAALRHEFPLEVVQLDDGYQSALGDWDTTNAKFPSGLARIADEIRAAGFRAGVWSAPFLAMRDSRLMREHPDWFITHPEHGPLRAGYNTNWTSDRDAFAYALDPSHPALREHLERLFARIVREFGYSYLKLDFLYAGAAEGLRHDPGMTRAEALRAGLDAIRRGAGDDAFILSCGCPLGPAVGAVDGMRIGPDVAPSWDESRGDPSTVHAIDAVIARSFMHRRLWLNDPDCLMLRARETRLNAEERGALAAVIAMSGGMLLVSDDMRLLERDAALLYRAVAALGAEIDAGAADNPVLALNLMNAGAVRGMTRAMRDGAIAMLVNRGNEPARIRLFDLRLGVGKMTLRELSGGERSLGDAIEIPAHAARFIRLRN
jgi:alpha-galactosidase